MQFIDLQLIRRKFAQTFTSSFRYIDVLSLNNSPFCDHLHCIDPNELEVKDTTDIQKSASYFNLHFKNKHLRQTR
jgi:hypothetical protein